MHVRVGLTTSDLTSLIHALVSVTSSDRAQILVGHDAQPPAPAAELSPNASITFTARGGILKTDLPQVKLNKDDFVQIRIPASAYIVVNSLKRLYGAANISPSYKGTLEVRADGEKIRIILISDLEDYLKGVLQSEMPASYHIQAQMAQAIAARTYALHPRINHEKDLCTVCDSYMCCQYFAGVQTINKSHETAIQSTSQQILTYDDKPILALFSSCSGGCTEDYESCFSDPQTNKFPPEPLPYLRSASEKEFAADSEAVDETQIRQMWNDKSPGTADCWANQFRWQVQIPASALESHMHHQIDLMRQDQSTAPFIVAPESGKFGHIKKFHVEKRGRGGAAIELSVQTHNGTWLVSKELVIRSVFENPQLKLKRLKSAKLYFDHKIDNLGFLQHLTVTGLGWGHGVGMQQTGAQGWAKLGKSCAEILAHYFANARIERT